MQLQYECQVYKSGRQGNTTELSRRQTLSGHLEIKSAIIGQCK